MVSKIKQDTRQIRSKYIRIKIFEHLSRKNFLNLIKYNKTMQKSFEIKLNDYKEYKNILEYNIRSIPEFKTDPKEIKYKSNLIDNISDEKSFSQNVFLLFKAFDNKHYLIYNCENKFISFYEITTNVIIKKIKISDSNNIPTCFNHYPDVRKKRDLIMSITASSNTINIYDIPNFNRILNMPKINKNGYLNTANFFSYDNKIYIMSTNHRYSCKNVDPIKIYDLDGTKIKELNDSNENVSFIDSYYDKKIYKKFIIAGFEKYIRAYDFEKNSIYKIYKDKYKPFHRNVIINDYDEVIKLIESASDGYVRIWDFHKGNLIKRILIDKNGAYGICLWNKENLFVGIKNNIKLINIETNDINSEINIKSNKCYDHYEDIVAIKKINIPKYGECLLTSHYGPKFINIIASKE